MAVVSVMLVKLHKQKNYVCDPPSSTSCAYGLVCHFLDVLDVNQISELLQTLLVTPGRFTRGGGKSLMCFHVTWSILTHDVNAMQLCLS
jgi:hypothetical protein